MNSRRPWLGLLTLAAIALALVWLRSGERHAVSVIDERAAPQPEPGSTSLELRLLERESSSSPLGGDAERSVRTHEPVEGSKAVPAKPADDRVQCVLYGKLLDAEHQAARSRRPFVTLVSVADEERRTGTSDAGDYSFAGLAPGAWTLSWGGSGFQKQTAGLELSTDTPIVQRDLTLEKAVVLAVWIVTPNGEPFGIALSKRRELQARTPVYPVPIATLDAPGERVDEQAMRGSRVGVGFYDESGVLVEEAGTGVLELSVDLPVFVSLVAGARVVATQRVEPGATEVTFVLDPDAFLELQGTVRARFVAEDTGEPLPGELMSGERASRVRDGVWEAVLTPGKHEFEFQSSGSALVPLHIALEAGQELDLGEIRVPRELTVEGRLLDSEGQPARCDLELGQRDERGVLRFDYLRMYGSDETGHYVIRGLVAAHYVIHTVADDEIELGADGAPPVLWVSGNVPVSTLGGSVSGFDLQLARAGILVLKGGQALVPETYCTILDEHGDPLRYGQFYQGFVPRFALAPGAYTLVLCGPDRSEHSRRSLTIGPGVTELDVGR